MDLINEVREFLKDNQIDYLLVNSTNEFLVEYAPLNENARYFLTNFSGSTGDALISQDKIFLFVDGRYHQQADLEVDKNVVTVVKLKIGDSCTNSIVELVDENKSFGIVTTKISQGTFEIFKNSLKEKNVSIKPLNSDIVMDFVENKNFEHSNTQNFVNIPLNLTGKSSEDKSNEIRKNLNYNEALLVTNCEEVSYLCNLRDFSANYSSKVSAKCLITKNSCWKCPKGCDIQKYLKDIDNIKKIYVDKNSITAYDYELLKDKAFSMKKNIVKEMKSIKTNAEIEHYKKCFEKTDKALFDTRMFIENNNNISEFDITKNLEENFYKYGAKSLSFKSIVAKDKNAALAHYSKGSKDEIIKDGSLILIDCGAYYEGGLATDITRVFIKGKANNLQKKVYTMVLKAHLKAYNYEISNITTGFDLDNTARKVFAQNPIEGFEFSHSLGHGIGISVHESPPSLAYSPMAKTPLKENMCFTIEPGLYKQDCFGVRLENSCFIEKQNEKNTIKSFSKMCFEKNLINFEMLSEIEKKQLSEFEVL